MDFWAVIIGGILGMGIIIYGTRFLCGTKKTIWNIFFISGIGSILITFCIFWLPMLIGNCGDEALGMVTSILFLVVVQICIALIISTLLLGKRFRIPRKIGLSVVIILVMFAMFVAWAVKTL